MAGVVAELVHVRGHGRGEPVALLEVDHEVGLRLPAQLGEGLDVLRAVDGDTHQRSAGAPDRLGLLDRRVDVLGARRAHALDGDGVSGAQGHAADAHGAGGIPLDHLEARS